MSMYTYKVRKVTYMVTIYHMVCVIIKMLMNCDHFFGNSEIKLIKPSMYVRLLYFRYIGNVLDLYFTQGSAHYRSRNQ